MKTIASAALLLALLAVGCSTNKTDPKDKKEDATKKEPKDDHDHGPGPNGGVIIEWDPKEQYHLEFTVNHETEEVKVYVLGPDAKTAKPIKSDKLTLGITKPKFTIDLKPQKEKNDPEGMASSFVVKDKRFGVKQEFAGEIDGVVDGKPYNGKFDEKPETPKK